MIEQLASKVHDAWWNEKKHQGFHSPSDCPNKRAPFPKFQKQCEKCHTDMYPYEELPDNIKEYDRVMVRSVILALSELTIV